MMLGDQLVLVTLYQDGLWFTIVLSKTNRINDIDYLSSVLWGIQSYFACQTN